MSIPNQEITELKKSPRAIEIAYSKQEQYMTNYSRDMQKLISDLISKHADLTTAYEKRIAELQKENTALKVEVARLKQLIK